MYLSFIYICKNWPERRRSALSAQFCWSLNLKWNDSPNKTFNRFLPANCLWKGQSDVESASVFNICTTAYGSNCTKYPVQLMIQPSIKHLKRFSSSWTTDMNQYVFNIVWTSTKITRPTVFDHVLLFCIFPA